MKYLLISLVLLFGLSDVTFGQSKWDKFFKKVEKASKEAQKIDKQIQQLQKSARKESPVKVPHFKSISKADFISGKYKKMINEIKKTKKKKFSKIVTLTGFNKKNYLNKNGNLNFWIDSKIYNYIENIHQIILLSVIDLLHLKIK